MTMPRRTAASRPAFTIVELLVVISIIAILLALTSVGVVQAGKTARQTKALSNLKQVATAWTQYASQNDDRAMPGFMDDGVQAALKIKVRDRDGNRVDPQFCRTYPYRLLPFLDSAFTRLYPADLHGRVRFVREGSSLGDGTGEGEMWHLLAALLLVGLLLETVLAWRFGRR
jgi:prepilin-type N-terminal cleavage/methylation domain-containing protein